MRDYPRNNRSKRRGPDRRSGRNGQYVFVKNGNYNNINRRRNLDNRRTFNRRRKLNQMNLNKELDNYFEKKGGDGLKDHLDIELELYQKNAKQNENLKTEEVNVPKAEEKEIEKKVEEPKQEMKVEEEVKETKEQNEQKEEKNKDDKKVVIKKRKAKNK